MMHHGKLMLVMLLGVQFMSGVEAQAKEIDLPSYELGTVIQLAIERNPLMAEAQGVIDQSQGQQIAAGAYPNPTVYGQTGHGAIRDPSNGDSITEYALTLGQPLEWPGKRAARIRAADAGFSGAGAAFSEKRLNLMAEVRIAFDELLFAQRQAELAEQNLGIVEDVKRIVTTRVRLGEAPQFEAIKAQVEVLKANQVVTRARNTVRVTRVALDTLTVGALGRTYAIKGEFRRVPGELQLEGLVASMLQNHPSLNRLARQVERADSTVDFERQARVPNVTVGGGYWREIGREAVTAHLSVPVPIWYQQKGEIASALGVRRQQEAELLRMRNELLRAVNLHYQDAQTTAEMIQVFEEGLLKQAEEALRIAQFSFRQGASSLLEVLDAQRVQRQILFDYTQARFDLSISLTRLERSIGGPL